MTEPTPKFPGNGLLPGESKRAPMIRSLFTLDAQTDRRIEDIARWLGESRSSVVRQGIRELHRKLRRLESGNLKAD